MIRRTNTADVAVPFVVVTALGYLVLRSLYESLPEFQWFTIVPIAALAIIEVLVARRVRNAVRHLPDAKVMDPLAIARAVALAKASVLGGAAVAGGAVALILTVLPDASRTEAARHDLRVGLALLVVSVLLVVAAVALERAAIDPNQRGR